MGGFEFFREADTLFLTNKCNNRCIICQDSSLGGGKEIMRSFEELKSDVDYFISKGVKNIQLYGGEPFLNPNILPILDYISRSGIGCSFSSNARVFADESLVKKIKKIKTARVLISLFSYKEEIHDYLTGALGSYRQTVAGIKNLVKENIPVKVTIVLTKKNIDGLEKTINFLSGLGVNEIKLSGLISQGRMVNRADLVPEFSAVKKEVGRAMRSPAGKLVHSFEKLPWCVAPIKEKVFLYEEQHKQRMLSCPPNREECVKCDLKNNCMCH